MSETGSESLGSSESLENLLRAEPAADAPHDRQLDLESLKALAHPLRVEILDTLSTYGEYTASGLAERLGESSGATSYHLRQLERHGFVREVEGKGTGRERWWERVPGGISLNATTGIADSPAGRSAAMTVMRQWERNRSNLLQDFQERGYDVLPTEWVAASQVATSNLRLTAEQLKEIVDEWDAVADAFVAKYRGQNSPGSRPVQIHFNAFPVIDGDVTPEQPEKEAREP
jgi:DNA-binding transcriptional ArsR family regulator